MKAYYTTTEVTKPHPCPECGIEKTSGRPCEMCDGCYSEFKRRMHNSLYGINVIGPRDPEYGYH